MWLMDALGYTMTTTIGGDHVGLRPDYSFFLRAYGGVGAHTMGNRTAFILNANLHGPIGIGTTDGDGIAIFPNISLRRSQNTWVKVGFGANYNDLTAAELGIGDSSVSEYYDRRASCISEYSASVAIDSTVTGVEWVGKGPLLEAAEDGLNSIYSNSSLTVKPPLLRVNGPAGNTPPGLLYAVMDDSFTDYPAHVGVQSFEYEPFASDDVRNWALGAGESLVPNEAQLSVSAMEGTHVGTLPISVPSVLGCAADFISRDPSSFGLYYDAVVDASASPTESSVFSAGFGALQVKPGRVGRYSVAAFVGGEVSETIPLVVRDPYDSVVALPWDPRVNGECPPPHNLGPSEFGAVTDGTFYPAIPTPCPNGCSGRGSCLCGVCICSEGYDGAFDCSQPFFGDDWANRFSNDDLYRDTYGGLVVYDSRRAMELGGIPGYFGDIFPRFLLPQKVVVGASRVRGGAAAVQKKLGLSAQASQSSGQQGVGSTYRVLDAADAFRGARILGGNFSASPSSAALEVLQGVGDLGSLLDLDLPSAPPQSYKVIPVLVTCSGDAVKGWSFVSGLTGCMFDPVPVASSFWEGDEAFTATVYQSNSFNFTQRKSDYRLHLHNVPTGCYRFKYVYGAQGPGNRLGRQIADPLASSQGRTLGMGRPFRVLSPVREIEELDLIWQDSDKRLLTPVIPLEAADNSKNRTYTVLRGAELPFSPSLLLHVRPRAGNGSDVVGLDSSPELTDGCSDGARHFLEYLLGEATPSIRRYRDLPFSPRPGRCPTSPQGGLDVTVTAVNEVTNLEYSLFVPGETADCARSSFESGSGRYTVVFGDRLRFPRIPTASPGTGGDVLALSPPTGYYRLKFTSYGTSLSSSYILNLVDLPSQLVNALDLRALVPESSSPIPTLPLTFSNIVEFPSSLAVSVGQELGERQKGLAVVFCGTSLFPLSEIKRINASALTHNWFPRQGLLASPSALALDRQVMSFVSTFLPDQMMLWAGELISGWNPVPSALVTSELLYGPPRCNARLRKATSTSVQGFADPDYVLLSGAPGLYVVRQTTATLPGEFSLGGGEEVVEALALLNVTSPISSVTITPPAKGGKILTGQPLSGGLRICAKLHEASQPPKLLQPLAVSLKFVAAAAAAGATAPASSLDAAAPSGISSPAPAWLRAVRGVSVHAMVPVDSDKWVEVDVGARAQSVEATGVESVVPPSNSSLSDIPFTLGSDACVNIRGLAFFTPQTTSFSIVASVLGFESPALPLTVTSIADANPVSLKKIKDRIATPLLIVLPLLVFNSVSVPKALRVLAGLGALASLIFLGASGGTSFEEEAESFKGLYSLYDLSFITALNATWWLTLGVVALITLPLLLGMIPVLHQWWLKRRRPGTAALSPPPFCTLCITRDHSSRRLQASFSYVRARLPRLAPTKSGEEDHHHHPHPHPHPHQHHHHEAHHHTEEGGGGAHHAVHHGGGSSSVISGVGEFLRAINRGVAASLKETAIWLHGLIFLEDDSLAFFFPQRLLVAVTVTSVFCLCVFMLVLYWCTQIEELARDFLAQLVKAAGEATQKAYYQRQKGGDIQVDAVNAFFQWATNSGSLPLSRCADQLFGAVSVVQDWARRGEGVPIPPSLLAELNKVQVRIETLTVEEAIGHFSALATGLLHSIVDKDKIRGFRDFSIAGAVLAQLFVAFNWWMLLINYKRTILGLRSGRGLEIAQGLGPAKAPDHDTPSKAVGFVGVQGASCAITLLLSSLLFTVGMFLLSMEWIQKKLWDLFESVLLWLLGTSFIIRVVKFLLFDFTLTADGSIHFRRAFSTLELYL